MIDKKYLGSGLFAVVSDDFGFTKSNNSIATEFEKLFPGLIPQTIVLPIPSDEKNIPGLIMKFNQDMEYYREVKLSKTRLDVVFSVDIAYQGFGEYSGTKPVLEIDGIEIFDSYIKQKLIEIYAFLLSFILGNDKEKILWYGLINDFIFKNNTLSPNRYMFEFINDDKNSMFDNNDYSNITITYNTKKDCQQGNNNFFVNIQNVLSSDAVVGDDKFNLAKFDINVKDDTNNNSSEDRLIDFFDLFNKEAKRFISSI